MEAIKKKRTVQYSGLLRIEKQMKPLMDERQLSFELKSKLESFHKKLVSDANLFYEATDDVLVKLKDNETDEASQCYDDKDKVIQLIVDVETKIASIQAFLDKEEAEKSIVHNNDSESTNSSSGIRYATIMKEVEPPEFDGDATKFAEWRAMFENLVHDNKDYTATSKLFFLKKCFVGDAKDVVSHYPITREGYTNAWNYVIGRFGKPKAVVGTFFKKLTTLEPIKHEGGIQKLLDTTNSVVRGLAAANEEVNDTMSRFIAYLTYVKLDESTRRDWDNHYTNMNQYPKFEEINEFLQSRAHVAAERIVKNKRSFFTPDPEIAKKSNCRECNGDHALFMCDIFKKKSPKDRYKFVKSKSLCLICLRGGHSINDCRQLKYKCNCGQAHNYLLHFTSPVNSNKPSLTLSPGTSSPGATSGQSTANNQESSKDTVHKTTLTCTADNTTTATGKKKVLLPSALVKFRCGDRTGKLRALLDSCSQATLISDNVVKKFNLPTALAPYTSSIRGVGSPTLTTSVVNIVVSSRNNHFQLEMQADVVPAASLRYSMNVEFSETIRDQIKSLPLADPAYLNDSISVDKIDMLIGAEFYGQCICNDSLQIGTLDLRLTQFGWTIGGVVPSKAPLERFVGFTRQQIDNDYLTKFWEIEEAESIIKPKVIEEEQITQHFMDTHSFAEDGKFIVRMPFKSDPELIDKNRNRALRALIRVEKNLNENQKRVYGEFMDEYLQMGHMAEAPHDPSAVFLPHRAVIRESSSTTPLRVVFNASAGKPSLNDSLMQAKPNQRDLFDILVDMRAEKIVFCADIAKMYRMIWVHPDDQKYQSIFWRRSTNDPILEFVLLTLTYGTGSAPFQATMCLEIIAREVEEQNPELARLIRNCFYMDDCTSGAQTTEKSIALIKELHAALAKHGFILRKYSSNSQEVLDSVPPELRADNSTKLVTEGLCAVPILGLQWVPDEDNFLFKVNVQGFDPASVVTKRIILSFVSRVFDPLGLVSPVVIKGKLLIQTLWREGLDWDVPVTNQTKALFVEYLSDLVALGSVRIPRYVFGASIVEIVGFCDASASAYCAAVYIRAKDECGNICCRLVAAKTRVAPVKELSIPKLELQAAELLVRLADRIATNLDVPRSRINAFSDNTTVLCWLSKPPNEWKTFVSNRVGKIIEIVPFQQWYYVPTDENPADFGTRGLSVGEFVVKKEKWIDGPRFVQEKEYCSYFPIPDLATHSALERRKINVSLLVEITEDISSRFSSYMRLVRVIAFLLRVKYRPKNEIAESTCEENKNNTEIEIAVRSSNNSEEIKKTRINSLTSDEVKFSEKIIIKSIQQFWYYDEIDRLKINKSVKKKSPLFTLNPFLDVDGVLRVGGRLSNSSLSDQSKNPIIVPAKCQFIKLFVRHVHEKFYHAGRKFLAAHLAHRYWIVGGVTNLIKFVCRTCITCRRMRSKTCNQIMGQLPSSRVTVAPPFANVGVDLAGPFSCKCTDHRATKFNQIYAAIFVCLTTRAIHIELVSGLSTEKFLLAFQVFVARRGLPTVVYSDNATNFVGTKNFLKLDENQINEFSVKENFRWQFIPPASPHMGGIWEAGVKSFKTHLVAVTKGIVLNIVEFSSLFAKIEAVLNSRPLCYKKLPEQGAEVITPSHFLIGRSPFSVPALDSEEISLTRRLQLVQNVFKGFWIVWRNDYLNQLQLRGKWHKAQQNLAVGQIVLVKRVDTKPVHWPLGVIEKLYPGNDGQVRVVDVRFNGQTKRRAIVNIVPLLNEEEL